MGRSVNISNAASNGRDPQCSNRSPRLLADTSPSTLMMRQVQPGKEVPSKKGGTVARSRNPAAPKVQRRAAAPKKRGTVARSRKPAAPKVQRRAARSKGRLKRRAAAPKKLANRPAKEARKTVALLQALMLMTPSSAWQQGPGHPKRRKGARSRRAPPSRKAAPKAKARPRPTNRLKMTAMKTWALDKRPRPTMTTEGSSVQQTAPSFGPSPCQLQRKDTGAMLTHVSNVI